MNMLKKILFTALVCVLLGTTRELSGDGDRLNTQELAGLQVSLGKRLFKNEADGPHGVEIESILLEKSNLRE